MPASKALNLQPPSVLLKYTIASSSPHSGKYTPENIIEDKPMDQASRWSGAFQASTNQWITLELESLSVLKTITFGKFTKPHPCNMKELKILVGATTEHMTEILHAGLKNDNIPETFALNHVNASGVTFPTRYVKVVPLMAHGQNFHVSVWHVGLTGIAEPGYVERIRVAYEDYRETTVMRYVLKHLRQRRLLSPFQDVLSRSGIQLEHPLMTQLHEGIVLQGDWTRSEQLLQQLSSAKLFDSYLESRQPYAEWTRISATDADGDTPPARGGHAMCIDPINEMIYILGGWDGEKSLDDFWVYSIKEDKWKLLNHSTTQEPNAPGARSCHKMVFDTKTGSIYVLGRLSDSDALRESSFVGIRPRITGRNSAIGSSDQPQEHGRALSPLATSSLPSEVNTFFSEFYRYHTRGVLSGKWDFLSIDTSESGGPPLVYDHQMVMDSEAQMIYVFGGRVVDGDWDTLKLSGLYSYNVSTSKWRQLQDSAPSYPSGNSSVIIPPRYGHSMVMDRTTKVLYIFSGQRDDKYLSDMYAYDIKTGISCEIFSDFSITGGPEACFTPRAVIDTALKEIYVISGLTKANPTHAIDQPSKAVLKERMHNWIYKYDSRPGKWSQILKIPDQPVSQRPMPRFAHQVVYNPKTKAVYMHGGNGGEPNSEVDETKDGVGSGRLDDFWKMELRRQGPEEIIRQCKFAIRQQRFREMCESFAPPVNSLAFLQKDIASVVDHQNKSEEEQFRSLLTHLLSPSSQRDKNPSLLSSMIHSTLPHESASLSSKHEDTQEGCSRPRKRSRSEPDPEEKSSSSSSGEENGKWTNDLSLLSVRATESSSNLVSGAKDTDPAKSRLRAQQVEKEKFWSGTRYRQRTEVFESLLKFVKDGEKQPDDDLLDLVESNKGLKGSGLL